MIDQIGRIKRLEEMLDCTIDSAPPEGQSQVHNIYWDNDLEKVVVEKEEQEE